MLYYFYSCFVFFIYIFNILFIIQVLSANSQTLFGQPLYLSNLVDYASKPANLTMSRIASVSWFLQLCSNINKRQNKTIDIIFQSTGQEYRIKLRLDFRITLKGINNLKFVVFLICNYECLDEKFKLLATLTSTTLECFKDMAHL